MRLTTRERVLGTICSALQYLADRGEIDVITEVETRVRYKHTMPKIDSFIVKVGNRRFEVTAEELAG